MLQRQTGVETPQCFSYQGATFRVSSVRFTVQERTPFQKSLKTAPKHRRHVHLSDLWKGLQSHGKESVYVARSAAT
jgi:hypothetical protein